jgi:signal transduction histidine kinase
MVRSHLHHFFKINQPLVIFVYGQIFFIMGLAIFLQSRRHSRLHLARDLRWLALFGFLHGLHEWGDIFIPIQANYIPIPYIELLRALQILLLGLSFACLMRFGAITVTDHWPNAPRIVWGLIGLWALFYGLILYTTSTIESWHHLSSIWTRYLLGFPGGMLAAYGLHYQAQTRIVPLGVPNIQRTLRVAVIGLIVYAILGGLIVLPAPFFPANTFNYTTINDLIGIPVYVFRSMAGFVLAISIIRALDIFEVEVDRLIEDMEIERIQLEERDLIGQEIHDGAIQSIYSASLLVKSAQQHAGHNLEIIIRLDRAQQALDSAVTDLRQYMLSLRTDQPVETLLSGLQRLAGDPRFNSLLAIELQVETEPTLNPTQVGYILSIAQECLANTTRHSQAHRVTIHLCQQVNQTELRIEDDGKGFDDASVVPGFGLRAMRDRARLLGGQLAIHSHLNKGTCIILTLPKDVNT